jgi:putative ABC transport system ATP-binding protein
VPTDVVPTDAVPTDPSVIVSGDRLTRRFTTAAGSVTALDDVDIEIEAGSLTVVAGPSGSGKSVLLSMISCTDRPTVGQIRVAGVRVTDLGRRARRRFRRESLGIVLPQPSDNLLDSASAIDNVHWAMRVRRGKAAARGADEAATPLMEAVGIDSLGHKRTHQLSGGEQQRLALVCALMGEPAVLVADEPTASLDGTSSMAVVAALRALAERGVTMIVATHDQHVIGVADHVIRLDHGRRVA